jgi:ERCC4 domain
VIDLVLDRPRLARSQFVFTETRGRPAIFWQTQKAAKAANPGARIPRARATIETLPILVDTRERYPYRFARRDVKIERVALLAGDYAVAHGEAMVATVERKTFENFTASLSDGTLSFQMQRLAQVGAAAVVVEGRYSALFKLEHVPAAFIADGLACTQVLTPRSRLSSQTRGSSPKSGPTASSLPVGVRNSDHPCDLRLRRSWPPARDGPLAPSRRPARAPAREPNVDED